MPFCLIPDDSASSSSLLISSGVSSNESPFCIGLTRLAVLYISKPIVTHEYKIYIKQSLNLKCLCYNLEKRLRTLLMIQDIFPHKLNNHYYPDRKAADESLVIVIRENEVLVKGDLFPRTDELKEDRNCFRYLFELEGENEYFLLDVTADEGFTAPENYEFVNVRAFRRTATAKKYRVFLAHTAYQLARWYKDNAFCGRCGKKTFPDGKERAIRCECGNVIYPRIIPAVIVGITNGDKILVTKYRTGFAHFALVAGFTEIGETLEETVAREAMEETGLKVKNIRYYKSQPWGIVDDLLVGFYCDVDGDDTISMDEGELKIAEWRLREDIELQPDEYSLTNEMMKMFKEGKA